MKTKKAGKNKMAKRIEKHEDMLRAYFIEEWDHVQKTAKKEALVRQAKDATFEVGKVLLKLLVVGGVCTITLVAPGVMIAYGTIEKRRRFFHAGETKKSIRYLKRCKYITSEKTGPNEYTIRVTQQGMHKAFKDGLRKMKIRRKKRWDGMWRIAMFDIPEKKKGARDVLREQLKNLGMYQLQKSVFVIPYKCEREVNVLATILEVEDYVQQFTTAHISGNTEIKRHFRIL